MSAPPVRPVAGVDAAAAGTWEELSARLRDCIACAEPAATRRQVVVGVAPAGAELLLLGEAPAAQEDTTGRPFVGRSGHHLDFVMAEAGLTRRSVAVLNVLKCRPPAGRAPTLAETANCRPWLERQIELIDPLLVVTLGTAAAEWALGRGTTLPSVRGHLHLFGLRRPLGAGPAAVAAGRSQWPLLPTYHPAAAIRVGRTGTPAMLMEQDLRYAAGLLPELRRLRAAAP